MYGSAVEDRSDPLADESVVVDTQNADASFHNYPWNVQNLFWQFRGKHGLWVSLNAAGVNALPVIWE